MHVRKFAFVCAFCGVLSFGTHAIVKNTIAKEYYHGKTAKRAKRPKPRSVQPGPCVLFATGLFNYYEADIDVSVTGCSKIGCSSGASLNCYGTEQLVVQKYDPIVGWMVLYDSCSNIVFGCSASTNIANTIGIKSNYGPGTYYIEYAITTGTCQFPGNVIGYDDLLVNIQ